MFKIKKNKKIFLAIGLIFISLFSLLIFKKLHKYNGVYEYDKSRDKSLILNSFDKDWYWLVAGDRAKSIFSPEVMLDTNSPNRKPIYKNKQNIKTLLINNKPVGFICYYKKSFYEGFIHILSIFPQYRGNGYSEKLVKYAMKDLFKKGVLYISLVTRTNNNASVGLYKKLGFIVDNQDDDYVYFEMTKNLYDKLYN